MKIIAMRFHPSSGRVLDAEEYESAANALGTIEERNGALRSVGYEPEWSVYLVDGTDWFQLTNYVNSWARFEFIQFIKSNSENEWDPGFKFNEGDF